MNVPSVRLKAAGYQLSSASSVMPNPLQDVRYEQYAALFTGDRCLPADDVERCNGLRKARERQELRHAYHEYEGDLTHR